MFEAEQGTTDTKLLFTLDLGNLHKNSAKRQLKYVLHLYLRLRSP
jgi:hypothetical protein